MDRAAGRKQVERFEGAARVRINARRRDGTRVPMVGLVPRAALEEIRRRAREAGKSFGGARIEARPLRLEVVQVTFEKTRKAVAARRITLGVGVRPAPQGAPGPERARPPVEIVLAADRPVERPARAEIVARQVEAERAVAEAVEG